MKTNIGLYNDIFHIIHVSINFNNLLAVIQLINLYICALLNNHLLSSNELTLIINI